MEAIFVEQGEVFCLSVIKLIKASNNYETNAIIYYNNDVNDDYNKT